MSRAAWINGLAISSVFWLVLVLGCHAPAETLDHLNQRINRSIVYCEECAPLYKAYVAKGNCTNYAATKRAELIRLGYDLSRLKVLVGKDEIGEGHAALAVDGDTILDNRFPRTETRATLERYGYRFD